MDLLQENEKLRGLLRDWMFAYQTGTMGPGHADMHKRTAAALAEPVEPAPAQDERKVFIADVCHFKVEGCGFDFAATDTGTFRNVETRMLYEGWKLARATRPAQTEQQPVAEVIWPDEPGRRGGFRQLGHYDTPRLSVGTQLYADLSATPSPAKRGDA